jgi:pimeloyl-ACP methyl ester carboxylesterase
MSKMLFLLIAAGSIAYGADLNCFIPIASGLGADGPFAVSIDTFQNKSDGERIHILYPDSAAGPFPPIVFCHGYGNDSPLEYWPLLKHIVSTGCVVVYMPGRKLSFTRNRIAGYDQGVGPLRKSVHSRRARTFSHGKTVSIRG